MPKFLMCPPDYFEVSYKINPWMTPEDWDPATHKWRAIEQWNTLKLLLETLGAEIVCMPPVPGLPDLVFTANAGVVLNRKVLLSNFKHPERQGEKVVNSMFFQSLLGKDIGSIEYAPSNSVNEGAGDCLFDEKRELFWTGFGPRSDYLFVEQVQKVFEMHAASLKLDNDDFYHLDTGFCPLSGGEVMMYPAAIASSELSFLIQAIGVSNLILMPSKDAADFACNAISFDNKIVMHRCGDYLKRELESRGYDVHETPLDMFLMAAGLLNA